MRAAALMALVAAAAPTIHSPASYIEQGIRADGRIEVMMLDEDGRAMGLVARRPRVGGLDLDKGYWFSCGRWQAQGDRLLVHMRLEESYRLAAPPGAGVAQDRMLAMSGALRGTGALRAELRDGPRRLALIGSAPVDAGTVGRLRFTCDQHDRNAATR